jgi:hypothetical protein
MKLHLELRSVEEFMCHHPEFLVRYIPTQTMTNNFPGMATPMVPVTLGTRYDP